MQAGEDVTTHNRYLPLHLGKVASACLLLGCKMEEKPRQILDIIKLLHVLGSPLWEGGGRVGVEKEEDNGNSAMRSDTPKLGATGNDGRRVQSVATIPE